MKLKYILNEFFTSGDVGVLPGTGNFENNNSSTPEPGIMIVPDKFREDNCKKKKPKNRTLKDLLIRTEKSLDDVQINIPVLEYALTKQEKL